MKLKVGLVFKYCSEWLDSPQWFFVVECLGTSLRGGEYMCCRTDYKLRGGVPSITDYWRISQEYFDECISKGDIVVENK